VVSCVRLDDNVDPRRYAPLTAYLLDRVRGSAQPFDDPAAAS
jgi:hypothetical protein